jgi:hypothetical protein
MGFNIKERLIEIDRVESQIINKIFQDGHTLENVNKIFNELILEIKDKCS